MIVNLSEINFFKVTGKRLLLSFLRIYKTTLQLRLPILMLIPCLLVAQKKTDASKKDSLLLEKKNYEKNLTKSLSYLSTGNSFSSLGNFAAISTDEKTIKGSVFFLNTKFNMYTLTVEAGASNGVGALSDEGSQGANVGLGIEHRILLRHKKGYVSTGLTAVNSIKKERVALNDKFTDSLLVLFNRINSLDKSTLESTIRINEEKDTIMETFFDCEKTFLDCVEAKKILPKEYNMLQKVHKALREYEKLGSGHPEFHKLISIKKELEKQQASLRQRMKGSIESVLSNKLREFEKDKKEKLKALDKKEQALKTKLIDLEFVALGAKASNKSFKYFNELLEPEKQIVSEDYTTKEFTITYASVRNIRVTERNDKGYVKDFEPGRLRYFSLASQFQITDNQDELTDVKVKDVAFENEEGQRTVVNERDAKIGDYKTDLNSLTFVADYYQFFSRSSNSVAIHISPKYIMKESSKPVTQFQIGFLFPFKKKGEEKTIVNVEIFYQLKDVFDTLDKFDNGFFKRNIVGIQTSFPFNFNF